MKKMILMLMAMVVFGNVLGADYNTSAKFGYKKIIGLNFGSYEGKGSVQVLLEGGDPGGYWLETNSSNGRSMLSALEIAYLNGIEVNLGVSEELETIAGYTANKVPSIYLIQYK